MFTNICEFIKLLLAMSAIILPSDGISVCHNMLFPALRAFELGFAQDTVILLRNISRVTRRRRKDVSDLIEYETTATYLWTFR